MRKAADGTGDVEVLSDRIGELPQAFTPDGTTIVFEERVGRSEIGMLRIDGDDAPSSSRLLHEEFAERNAALSPDGRWLAYQSDESGRFEIFVRPFPDVNGGRWQISTDGGTWPLWNPRGGELFFRGPTGVMALAFTTEPTFTPGELRELFGWEFAGERE